ncbi:NAD(P)H-dependent oxidoreductase [Dysgonomonas sp. 511]|uniref:NAD(P)H-dependent oxidoreductase n=1 Tax=Dysgonomonas sp. 511 TaxID=2302930 RepID=UPI0013D2A240|nr:NAD(P)H-dependent oxidoreductase [Dysgonomonas sp. 511]NDV79065.1 NAD(P)H-dependent oxidoreductase [Dysgonomonas sp. 511]
MNLIDDLKWRYAVKKFDPAKKVKQELVEQIIEAARLAPTSSGLQPFRIIEITNQDLKEKIVPLAMNQKQVADCSHLLVFAAWDNYTEKRIDNIYSLITTEREQAPDQYSDYTNRLKKAYLNRPGNENFDHAARQAYIALGFAMAMAAELRVDTTPMEGFDNNALDQLLDLNKAGLKSVTLLPLGYRDELNDWLVNLKKVRHPEDEFLVRIR